VSSLLIRSATIVTPEPSPRPRRGSALGELSILPGADVLVEQDRIAAVGERLSPPPGAEILDAGGRLLLPGFVDCHTHACWAGDRLDEWAMRLQGATYQEIMSAGGGIMSTVRAVREASQEQLERDLLARLNAMLRHGTTTVEVKSGYGLTTHAELKMLRAIRAAAAKWPGTVVLTALLGHAMDPDVSAREFVDQVVEHTLPAISSEFPGIAIDAFCETGAWSLADCVRLFKRARELGHPIRVHADQFNSLGMIPECVRLGALSIDHLENTRPEDLELLARSNIIGVLLPCCGLHLGAGYAHGRKLIDAGGAACIATNCNPGSAPCVSMPMAMALAVRFCGLTPAEAIVAATVNPASLLGLTDRGTIGVGQRADLVLLQYHDHREVSMELGGNAVEAVIVGGRRVV
jgi:imidazolonepropionase